MNAIEIITNDERCLKAYHENMHHYEQDYYGLIDLFSKTKWPKLPLWFFKWIRNPSLAKKEINEVCFASPTPEKESKPKRKRTTRRLNTNE